MEKNNKSLSLIANAIFWAAAILGASYFFKGQPWSEYLIFGGILGFIVVNGILMSKKTPRC